MHEFGGTFRGGPATFRVTAVKGHVYNLVFTPEWWARPLPALLCRLASPVRAACSDALCTRRPPDTHPPISPPAARAACAGRRGMLTHNSSSAQRRPRCAHWRRGDPKPKPKPNPHPHPHRGAHERCSVRPPGARGQGCGPPRAVARLRPRGREHLLRGPAASPPRRTAPHRPAPHRRTALRTAPSRASPHPALPERAQLSR